MVWGLITNKHRISLKWLQQFLMHQPIPAAVDVETGGRGGETVDVDVETEGGGGDTRGAAGISLT